MSEFSLRPTIVCLCGSTRFWREFQRASLRETMAGKIVLSIGAASGTDDEHFGNLPKEEYDRIKVMLDELHLRKIDLADEVLILTQQCYIGESTFNEIEYAQRLGKRVRWLEPAAEGVFNGMAQGRAALGGDAGADCGGEHGADGLASQRGDEGENQGQAPGTRGREAAKATEREAGQERMEVDR